MKKRGKKYLEKIKFVDRVRRYSPSEAMQALKQTAGAKFDETVEVHFNLGIDPKQAEQQLRGTLSLPHGTGRDVRVVAIVDGEAAIQAKGAGADFVGGDDLIEKIQKGWLDFDLVIATPTMMAKVGRLGKLLGAKGLMPNPKSGTVTTDVAKAVKDFKSGKLEYRNDKNGIIHLRMGKASFTADQLKDNFMTVYEILEKVKPTKAKGIYFKSVAVCTTMGPSVILEPQRVKWKE